MRNIESIAVVLLSVAFVVTSGCDSKDYSLAEVSGTVTYEGNPVPKLKVAFSPQPVGDNFAVGPYSSGVTDASGKFTLKTRYDEPGAVIGKHSLTFKYSDISETAMSDLRVALSDAKDMGDKADFDETRKKIAALKAKLKGRPVLRKYKEIIDVPSAGLPDLDLDISVFGQK